MSELFSLEERPFSHDDIIGNKGVMKTFKEYSKTRQYPDVMFFAGDSGTGKTTLALLVSALLIDKNPVQTKEGHFDPNPESPTSIAIREEKFNNNVLFYNASTMDKNAVNALEDEVSMPPLLTASPIKILIIDEAQELGKAAKGSTLKLLEKKRKNVYIILCTMNLESFDKSIRSRGQVYQFKAPLPGEIADHLFNILDRRGLLGDEEGNGSSIPDEFIEKGLLTIAENCEGSVRQAVQLLQRCVAGEIYSQADILKEFGILSNTETLSLLQDLLIKSPRGLASLELLDLKESFYLLWKILTDAFLFKVNPKDESDWKSNQSRELAKSPHLEKLLSVFDETEQALNGYFRPAVFLTRLAKYYLEGTVPSVGQTFTLPAATRERTRA